MTTDHFVGREEPTARVRSFLATPSGGTSKLRILSIEGPGGIGKTSLFEHAISSLDLTARNYLTLTLSGNDQSANTLDSAIASLIQGADAAILKGAPRGQYFSSVTAVLQAITDLRAAALIEVRKSAPELETAIQRWIDFALQAGKTVNDVAPSTRQRFDVHQFEKSVAPVRKLVPEMVSLGTETAAAWEKLGLGRKKALRNEVKQNACHPVADALVADLSAMLSGYRKQDRAKPTRGKLRGVDNLLLVLDDYEKLQGVIGEFLTGYFLPALKTADFETSVVILGRDQLENTHPAWDQHFRGNISGRITLKPLTRSEVDDLVESFGIHSAADRDRVWRDTEGYPLYVQLWVEEMEQGGQSAVMLKRFYDRTTRWMTDQQKNWLHNALLLDDVNVRSLRLMLGEDSEAMAASAWFQQDGSVRDTSGTTFRVREYLRSRLVEYLRVSDPDLLYTLRRKAARASQPHPA